MKKPEVFNTIARAAHKAGFQLKKHSPEILIAAGVVGTVASAVLACKATTKVKDILEDTKEQLDQVHEVLEREDISEDRYSQQDANKDITIIYAQTAVKFVKLYAPAVILGALSLTSIITSHNILRKRNVALAAAYTAVDRSFKQYRKRVVDRFGDALDKELRYGVKSKEIETTIVDDKGKEKKAKEIVNYVDDPTTISEFAVFFDESCPGWTKNAEFNKTFLIHQQNLANEMLKSRGYFFLNDAYSLIGAPKTAAGQIVGWIYDPSREDIDSYIDFNIFDGNSEAKRLFVNGHEKTILLDFNVDGPILDYM